MNISTDSSGPTANDFRPELLFHRPDLYLLEFGGANALFVRMTRETYRRSIFTDRQRIVAASAQGSATSVGKLLSLYESQDLPQPRLCYVFHVAHCGSTLLARALDHSSDLLVCREPSTLRQLAMEYAATTDDAINAGNWHRRLQLVTGLLGRTYESSRATIVKTNVPVNFILPQLMELNSGSCGILLYTTIRRYLLSVLKSPQHQQWVSNVTRDLAGGIRRIELLADIVPEQLSPAASAACLWLAQMLNYTKMLEASDRLRSLDSEILFDRPADTLNAAFSFFDVDIEPQHIQDVVSGDLFTHHAKVPGFRFDNAARKAELEALAESLGDQVQEGIDWVSGLVEPQEIPTALAKPLVV